MIVSQSAFCLTAKIGWLLVSCVVNTAIIDTTMRPDWRRFCQQLGNFQTATRQKVVRS